MRRGFEAFEAWWADHFLKPQFEAFGDGGKITRPWNIDVHGPGITVGDHPHFYTAKGYPTRLSTWAKPDTQPRLAIGDHVLISPGALINAAERIDLGDNVMLASQVIISDSDWHDHYDRASEPRAHAPVVLEANVWLGLRVIVAKGVRIGANTIVGAGSIVVDDLPANVIAAGTTCSMDNHQSTISTGTLTICICVKVVNGIF
jgi:acetyltransferase-like isoleucine patch superfamily enzyme